MKTPASNQLRGRGLDESGIDGKHIISFHVEESKPENHPRNGKASQTGS